MFSNRSFVSALLLALTFGAFNLKAKTIFVDETTAATATPFGSWETAAPNLQEALQVAVSGDQIWIAKGTYYPDEGDGRVSDDRSANFRLKNGVGIYGGFAGDEDSLESADPAANPTILSGEIQQDADSSNNTYHVISAASRDASAILQGFTIQDGNANAPGEGFDTRGGGLNCFRASPTIIDCLFLNNGASTLGGAIYNKDSSPTFTSCSFEGNQAQLGGAVANAESSAPRLVKCAFLSNTGDEGGAFYNTTQSSPELESCEFSGNQANRAGGALYNFDGSTPVITNCVFLGNRAKFPGGGAIANSSSSPVLLNCSFQGNRDNNEGGAIRNMDVSSPKLTNCLIWNNRSDNSTNTRPASVFNENGSVPIYSHCLVENYDKSDLDSSGTSPNTNLEPFDPLFLLPADLGTEPTTEGDLHLKYGSFAIDKGLTPAPVTSTDFAGNPRIVNAKVDLGAIEGAYVQALWTESDPPFALGDTELRVTLSLSSNDLPEAWKDALSVSRTGTATSSDSPTITGADSPYTVVVGNLAGEGRLRVFLDPVKLKDAELILAGDSSFDFIVRAAAVSPRHFVKAGNPASESPYDTWETAASKLQDALAHAALGDEVWVAKGTYYPDQGDQQTSGDRTASFPLQNGVAIYGGFVGGETNRLEADPSANETILSGDIDQDALNQEEDSYHVVTAYSTDETAQLHGFTITAGNADDVGNEEDDTDKSGGGLYCDGASPTLTDCLFKANYAYRGGGGIFNNEASPTLTNCSFQGNSTTFDGGAIENRSSSPALTNCAFQGNKAVEDGGAISNRESSPLLTNCTFQGNYASSEGGAIYNRESSAPKLTNCLIWNNGISEQNRPREESIFNSDNGPGEESIPIFSFCLVEHYLKLDLDNSGSSPDTNFKPEDPLFLLPSDPLFAPAIFEPLEDSHTEPSLSLRAGSPALDVGGNDANPTTKDLAGNPRIPDGTTIDLGAYEGAVHEIESWVLSRALEPGDTSLRFNLTLKNNGKLPDDWPSTVKVTKPGSVEFDSPVFSGSGPTYVITLTGLSGDGFIRFAFDETLTRAKGFSFTNDLSAQALQRSSGAASNIYVNATSTSSTAPYDTWETAANELQDALDFAIPGDTVWVAQGTYYPDQGERQTPGDRFASFQLQNGVAIYGGFVGGETEISGANPFGNETILSGDIDRGDLKPFNADDDSHHVVTASSTDETAQLHGFTITGGRATGIIDGGDNGGDNLPGEGNGGGLFCLKASPTLTDCLFQDNDASDGFSGRGGQLGGAIYNEESSPKLTNCSFRNNRALYGGAIGNDRSSPTFTNCAFQTNFAQQYGGAIYNEKSIPVFINCSFQGNNTEGDGGALYNTEASSPNLTNCIIWNNGENANTENTGDTDTPGASVYNAIIETTVSIPIYSFCLVENYSKNDLDTSGASPNTNLTPRDPRFVLSGDLAPATTTVGNLRLRLTSTVIDKGNSAANPSPSKDLGGMTRLQGTTIDLGAYEGGVDPELPVIVLKGTLAVVLPFGSAWNEPGAFVTDNKDSEFDVIIDGDTVDPSTPGTYTLTYRVIDSDGNSAIVLTRTVTVGASLTLPVIDLTLGSGGRIETLTWSQGWILQDSNDLKVWTDIPGASSPFTVTPNPDLKGFWRLRLP